jgi:hypothetical protein
MGKERRTSEPLLGRTSPRRQSMRMRAIAPSTSSEARVALEGQLSWLGGPWRTTRWLPWVGKGSLAVLDQGLISGANFLITILLARWLTAGQYGAYTLAFSIFLLLGSVHDSLVSEPMTVFGPSSHVDHRREYLGAVLKIEAVLGLVCFAVLGLSAVIAYYLAAPSGFAGALAGLTVSAPCVFLLWLTRFALYVEQSPGSAALGALFYSALVLSGTLLIFRRGLLSPFTAFIVIALGHGRGGWTKSTTQPLPASYSGRKLLVQPRSTLHRRDIRQARSDSNQVARTPGDPVVFRRGKLVLGSPYNFQSPLLAPPLRREVSGACLSCPLGYSRWAFERVCLRVPDWAEGHPISLFCFCGLHCIEHRGTYSWRCGDLGVWPARGNW